MVALQVRQQVEDLGLDRDVQRRCGLVANQQFGFDREGAGDGDALALAAGELVRIALCRLGVQANLSSSSAKLLLLPIFSAAMPSARISPTLRRGLSEL